MVWGIAWQIKIARKDKWSCIRFGKQIAIFLIVPLWMIVKYNLIYIIASSVGTVDLQRIEKFADYIWNFSCIVFWNIAFWKFLWRICGCNYIYASFRYYQKYCFDGKIKIFFRFREVDF